MQQGEVRLAAPLHPLSSTERRNWSDGEPRYVQRDWCGDQVMQKRVKENPCEGEGFASVSGPQGKGKDSPGQGVLWVAEQPGEAKAHRIRYTFWSSEHQFWTLNGNPDERGYQVPQRSPTKRNGY